MWYAAATPTRSAATAPANRSAKYKVVKRSAAQTIDRAENVLVSLVNVLVTRRGFIQIKQYTIAVEDALASVVRNIRPHLALMSISAMTILSIFLRNVRRRSRTRVHWTVMAQQCLGDVLVASRAIITLPTMYLARCVGTK